MARVEMLTKRTTILLALLTGITSASADSYNIIPDLRVEPFLVDRDTIAALEAAVKMPDGASSLDSYVRYYAGVRLAGERTVQGVMFSPRLARFWQPDVEPRPGAYILSFDQLPKTGGGRCEHIQL